MFTYNCLALWRTYVTSKFLWSLMPPLCVLELWIFLKEMEIRFCASNAHSILKRSTLLALTSSKHLFLYPDKCVRLVRGISTWFEHTVRRALHVFPVRAWIRNSHLSSPRPRVDSVQWEGGGPSVIGKSHYKPHSRCMEELSCCISQCVCMVCMA